VFLTSQLSCAWPFPRCQCVRHQTETQALVWNTCVAWVTRLLNLSNPLQDARCDSPKRAKCIIFNRLCVLVTLGRKKDHWASANYSKNGRLSLKGSNKHLWSIKPHYSTLQLLSALAIVWHIVRPFLSLLVTRSLAYKQ